MFDPNSPIYYQTVDGRFDCSLSTNSGKFDLLKLDRFSVF